MVILGESFREKKNPYSRRNRGAFIPLSCSHFFFTEAEVTETQLNQYNAQSVQHSLTFSYSSLSHGAREYRLYSAVVAIVSEAACS